MPLRDNLLLTKLLAPRTSPNVIERPRLSELTGDYHDRKITLITAPAGYGKTVFISQLAERADWPAAWYQLDHFDNDLSIFIRHLVAAIAHKLPGFGADILKVIEHERNLVSSLRPVIVTLINDLSAHLTDGLLLVMDDYHTIEEQSVHAFMDQFLEYLPPEMHLVLASRTRPPLHLARLKAAGLLCSIDQELLRFNRDEITSFLIRGAGEPLPVEMIEFLEEETAGWPAALRLAGLSLETLKVRWEKTPAAPLTYKKELYQYLAAEVMGSLPPELAAFLSDTCVLDFLTPQICNIYLQRSDSQQVLEELEDRNLFITSLEGQAGIYRYHHLFQEFLLNRLGQSYELKMIKAGESFLRAGYLHQAVECLLKGGDLAQALPAIEMAGEMMLRRGRWQTVRRWLQAVPADKKRELPRLLLYEGAVATNGGNLTAGKELLKEAESVFLQAGDEDGLFQTRLYLARIYRSLGDYDEGSRILKQIMPGLSGKPVSHWYDVIMEHAFNLSLQGEFDNAIALLSRTFSVAEHEKESYIAAQLADKLGELYFAKGEYSKAQEVHQRAAELAPDYDRLSYSLRNSLTYIYRERGDLKKALTYARKSLKIKEEFGLVETLPYAYHQLAVVLADLGEDDEAERNFRRSIDLARQLGGENFFIALSLAIYGRFVSTRGRLQEARSMVEEALTLSEGQSDYIYGICLKEAAPIYVKSGQRAEGEVMLRHALELLEKIDSKYSLFIACGIMCMLSTEKGNMVEAEVYGLRCLELAAAENYLQGFISYREMSLPVLKTGLEKGRYLNLAAQLLPRLGQEGVELLLQLSRHRDPAVRLRIIKPLSSLDSTDGERVWQLLLQDNDERVKEAAQTALQGLRVESSAQAGQEQQFSEKKKNIKISEKPHLKIFCLGLFQAECGEREINWRTVKSRDLLAFLIHQRGRPTTKEKAVEAIWPDLNPGQSHGLFHTNLYQLRKAVKEVMGSYQLVKLASGQYVLNLQQVCLDLDQFEDLARMAEQENQHNSPKERIRDIEEAVALYRGDYLQGLDYPWIGAERQRLHLVYLNLMQILARNCLLVGRPDQAVTYLQAILFHNPLLEDVHAQLMKAYAAMGDRLALVQQYETLTQILQDELGIEPGSETKKLYHKLCREGQ